MLKSCFGNFIQIYSSEVIIEPDPGFYIIPVTIDAALGNETVITVVFTNRYTLPIVVTGPDSTRVDHDDPRYHDDMENNIVSIKLPLAQVKPVELIFVLFEETLFLPFFLCILERLMVSPKTFWKPSYVVRLFTIFRKCVGNWYSKVSSQENVGFSMLVVIFCVHFVRRKARVNLSYEQN